MNRLIELLKTRIEAGVSVTVLTLSPEEVGYGSVIELYDIHERMKQAGFYVRLSEEENEHFAVVDKTIVWHGGMNLLGKADAWDNLIRLKSRQAAEELLEMADEGIHYC